ncbi:hypothetical protein ACFXAS_23935 [Streptomyces sp. NPDC059459]|uniref:hypothetical protein n=1 Tax=Streptomyces sp. NPDC059459 TaxID=3346839 RepID=UPI0036ADE0B3
MAALLLSAGLSVGVLTGCSSGQETDQAYGSTRVTAQQMVHLLETSLPEGKVAERRGNGVPQGDKPGRPPAAELLFGDGARAVKVSVQLAWYPVPVPAQLSECPDTAYHPYSRCTQRVLPDGARLVLDTSPQAEDKPAGGERHTALLTYKDGKQVSVSAVGAPTGPAPAGRAPLVLSLGQVSAVATSKVWRPALSAMPAPPSQGPQTDSASRMTGPEITRVIEQLLPKGLHADQEGGSTGFGHVVVDDGRGKSLVTVNVQRWAADDPRMERLFHDADLLPDGTRVSISEEKPLRGGKGTVQWSVDALRTDGLRVVVSSTNAPAYLLPAGRDEPALDTRMLQRIALDPAWQQASH